MNYMIKNQAHLTTFVGYRINIFCKSIICMIIFIIYDYDALYLRNMMVAFVDFEKAYE